MKNFDYKKAIPHVIAVLFFILITVIYYSPATLHGKILKQDDITRNVEMSKEINDFRAATGKEALWTNSMFGGMPAYNISVNYNANLINKVSRILNIGFTHPLGILFITLLGFYLLLICLNINPWLSIFGAVAYAFSSYFFIIIEAGHNSKAATIAYIAPVIAGVILSFRGKYFWGGILTALSLALAIRASHPQITYYLFFIVLFYGIIEFINAIKYKTFPRFFKATGVLIIAVIIAVGTSASSLWATYEYGKYSTRGKSELTFDKNNKTSGLDKDYATSWSYGKVETMTLLIPDFMGGSSTASLGKNSETYKMLNDNGVPNAEEHIKYLPLYWGTQPFTSGPVYVGAIIFFLFIFGLFVVKGTFRWWLLFVTIFSVLLAWGRNFMPLTDFFLDHFPGYNKFRSVSMILVMAEFAMPLMAVLVLNKIFEEEIDVKRIFKHLKNSFYIVGGICLLFALFGGSLFNFVGSGDSELKDSLGSAGWPENLINGMLATLPADRASLLRSDSWRSLIFIVLSAVTIWAVLYKKIKKEYAYVILIALVLVDMWSIDRRYLNNDDFITKQKENSMHEPTQADQYILQDQSPDYRVLNLAVNTFNDASTSYFHKSIGGYHGAKMKRYQELIEFHIAKEIQEMYVAFKDHPSDTTIDEALSKLGVINMLNTRYIIYNSDAPPLRNKYASGNAWFVDNYKLVNNADEEITQLNKINPAATALIDKRYSDMVKNYKNSFDSTASIKLESYKPNELIYNSKTSKEQIAVFSEIFYDKGWNVYVDDEKKPYFRADYVLRAMVVPAGQHKIEFRFEPILYSVGEKVSLASSLLILLVAFGGIVFELKRKI
ncbi:MAG: YfhO family protein [Bacteroidales bacterium]|nr:YfhO family protein [Bacteroidales bacterium]